MKINVLGTEYTIRTKKRHKDTLLKSMDGYCDDSVKRIVVSHLEPEPDSKHDLEAVWKKVLRHEIIHAFLSESGLAENRDWAQNEEIVDWIAIQGPKIYKVWKEVGAV